MTALGSILLGRTARRIIAKLVIIKQLATLREKNHQHHSIISRTLSSNAVKVQEEGEIEIDYLQLQYCQRTILMNGIILLIIVLNLSLLGLLWLLLLLLLLLLHWIMVVLKEEKVGLAKKN